jgi:hypothetical protein
LGYFDYSFITGNSFLRNRLRICRTNQDWDAYWLNLSSISS